MPYTRRDLIRDAALISVTAAVAAAPSAFGKNKKRKVAYPASPPNPANFNPGVRIFFVGSWLFCAGPQNTNLMWAVGRNFNFSAQKKQHIFPYGAWPKTGGIDDNSTSLPSNDTDSPYSVSVTNYRQNHKDVDDLFGATRAEGFTYFPNTDGDMRFNKMAQYLRIISVPIPTQIIAAAFLDEAYISYNDNVAITTPSEDDDFGIPTAHIFDYQGPQAQLNFQPPPGSLINYLTDTPSSINLHSGTDYASNLHFHTVLGPKLKDWSSHPQEMFTNLLNIVPSKSAKFGSGDLTLSTPSTNLYPGDYVPITVDPSELETLIRSMDLAGCAGGSFGVGGDVGN